MHSLLIINDITDNNKNYDNTWAPITIQQQISILKLFLKDHVTLKTWIMSFASQEYITF